MQSPESCSSRIAAAMWGLDPILRKPLSHSTTPRRRSSSASTSCSSLLTLPLLAGAARARDRPGRATSRPPIAVGAGASAIATILFTRGALPRRLHHAGSCSRRSQPLVAVVGAGRDPRRAARGRASPGSCCPRSPASGSIAPAAPARAARRRADPDRRVARRGGALGAWAPCSAATSAASSSSSRSSSLRFSFGLIASAVALPIVGDEGLRRRARQPLDRATSRSSPASSRSVSTTTA